MIREPAVAGRFYPRDADQLRQTVNGFLMGEVPIRSIGVISPHAGYVYSGAIAGATLARVEIPEQVIVLCPNHTGQGAWAAINTQGAWRTPLGDIPVASKLALELQKLYPACETDMKAHAEEHALEVQLPFLQALQPKISIVPLCLSHFSWKECEALGSALAELIQSQDQDILILASSDLNHYESQERTLEKDQIAIDCILELDPEKLYHRVHEEHISMCGIIPSSCMLVAARALGASKAQLIRHATSGDVSGDYSGVVGYAGIAIR